MVRQAILGRWQGNTSLKMALASITSGLPWWLSHKESACNARDVGSIPGLGRSPGEGKGNSLQYSFLDNPTDRGGLSHGGLQSKESDTTEATEHAHVHIHYFWNGMSISPTETSTLSQRKKFSLHAICPVISLWPEVSILPFIYVFIESLKPKG